MKVIDEMHKWSWWKVIGWLIYLLFLAVLVFALWYGIWWVAAKSVTHNG